MDVQDMGHSLTKKAGPFPLWVWGVGIGAIAVAVMWMHSRGSTDAPLYEPDADAALDGMDSALDTTYDGNNSNDGGGGSGGGSSGTGQEVSEEDADVDTVGASGTGGGKGGRSNKRWQARAFRALVASGKNPVAVQRALSLYLSGEPLNLKQKRLVKQALQASGMPPQGAPGITVKKPPKRPPHGGKGGGNDDKGHTHPHVSNSPHGPRRDRTVTAEAGDTYSKLAKRAYGSASGVHVDRVRRANGGGTNQTFKAGDRVRVPYHDDGRRRGRR